jgi:hypothetical protein
VCGAILAGGIAWAMMSGGVSASRTRAVLLTVCGAMLFLGAVLPLAILPAYGSMWPILLVGAVCTMAYMGWETLLYSAIADALPARGVAIGAAIGVLAASLGGWLVSLAAGRLLSNGADQLLLPEVAATAAIALLVVALLAWLVRQEPETAGSG